MILLTHLTSVLTHLFMFIDTSWRCIKTKSSTPSNVAIFWKVGYNMLDQSMILEVFFHLLIVGCFVAQKSTNLHPSQSTYINHLKKPLYLTNPSISPITWKIRPFRCNHSQTSLKSCQMIVKIANFVTYVYMVSF
jgi:hypothetical protein